MKLGRSTLKLCQKSYEECEEVKEVKEVGSQTGASHLASIHNPGEKVPGLWATTSLFGKVYADSVSRVKRNARYFAPGDNLRRMRPTRLFNRLFNDH